MKPRISFEAGEILPRREEVYRHQGITDASRIQDRIQDIYLEAMELFTKRVDPIGILSEVTVEEFGRIFEGEGNNAAENPVRRIYPRADHLALFALTLGGGLGGTVDDLFDAREFALGTMLDSVASLAADRAVEVLETMVQDRLRTSRRTTADVVVLSYSPGYCGWDISGQKRLFEHLRPERIGVSLNETCLMSPLKSVTGVLIAGDMEIHFFGNDFPFCSDCESRSCRLRMDRVLLRDQGFTVEG